MKNYSTHGVHNPHEDLMDKATRNHNMLHENVDDTLREMEKQMDLDAAETGMTIAGLFRTLTMAYLTIPPMEFHSELICVVRDEGGITVTVCRPDADGENDEGIEDIDDLDDCDGECEHCNGCDGLADDYDDEEEEYHED